MSYGSEPSGGPPRQAGGRSRGCTQEAEGRGLVEKRRVRETTSLSLLLKWESPEKTEPDSSQGCAVTGQETTGKTLSVGSFSHHKGGDTGTGTQRRCDISVLRSAQNRPGHGPEQPAATGPALSRRQDWVASGGPVQAKFLCDHIKFQLKAKINSFSLIVSNLVVVGFFDGGSMYQCFNMIILLYI